MTETVTAVTTIQNHNNVSAKIAELIPAGWREDRAFQNMIRAIHTVAYMKLAVFVIQRYLKYQQTDRPGKLIHKQTKAIEKSISDYLTDSSVRNSSKRVQLALLKLFYTQNDINLNWPKISKIIGKREKIKNRGYTVDEISKMLQHSSSLRDKLIILLLASTGMRIEGLANLKIRDTKLVTKDNISCYAITVYANEPEEYVTFCTPECARLIDEYIQFRQRIKEPFSDDSPLIRDEVSLESVLANPDLRIAKPVTKRAIEGVLKGILVTSGIKQSLKKTIDEGNNKVRYEVHLSRGFRKFAYNAKIRAEINPVYRAYLHGHLEGTTNLDSSQLAMIYSSPSETELFDAFSKAIPHLTINQELKLQEKVTELQEKVDDIELLKQQVDSLRKREQSLILALLENGVSLKMYEKTGKPIDQIRSDMNDIARKFIEKVLSEQSTT